VTSAALRYIESLPADDAPLFLWVHLFDAHEPHTPDAADAARFVDPAYAGPLLDRDAPVKTQAERVRAFTLDDAPLDATDRAYLDQNYRAAIAGCDARLGRIAAALEARGRLRDALRIYTADHGEDLGEHRRYYGHGNSIFDTSLHVPLVIAFGARFQAGARAPQLTQNFDVFATILCAAGVAPPADTESLDLAPLARGDGAARGRGFVFGDWEDRIHSVSDGAWKLIHNPEGLQPRNPPFEARPGIGFPYRCRELYNVATDPLEQIDLYAEGHPEAKRLRTVLERFLGDHAAARRERGVRTDTLDPASIEALHALGYLGGSRHDLPRIDCGEARR
jgi:arylsulfatase